ncbi:MAG: Ldh family oxidoreductase [Clostridia bacterium]|nr:Ldh family oxidoreductase [Clostridia bacterium]
MAYKHYQIDGIVKLSQKVFESYGYTPEESAFITDVIVTADLYGVESHGVNRLALYTYGINIGRIKLGVKPEIVKETPVSATIDAHDGEGHIASKLAMELAIEKAKATGIGLCVVRNSNHFGIAGYYARMALKHDLMGLCLTNAEAMIIPTFGKKPMLGTNPIAVAMPAQPVPYYLDMATSVVPGGKLEVYAKNDKPLPQGWILDKDGNACSDSHEFIKIRDSKSTGGILPLGGEGETFGGHKGYGLALLVELMTGTMSGGVHGDMVRLKKNEEKCCHFFCAMDYGMFGDKKAMYDSFSAYLERIRESPKAHGQSRIFTHGEKAAENERRVRKEGIRINDATMDEIKKLSQDINLDYTKYMIEV